MVRHAETIDDIPVVAVNFIVYQLQALWALNEFEFLCKFQHVVQVDVEFWSLNERDNSTQWHYHFQINADRSHLDANGQKKPAHLGYEIHKKMNTGKGKKDDVGHVYVDEERVPMGRPQLGGQLKEHKTGTMKYKLEDDRIVFMKHRFYTRL